MADELEHRTDENDTSLEETLSGLRHELDAELPTHGEAADILDREPSVIEIPQSRLKAAVPGIFGEGVDYDPDNQASHKRLYQTFVVVGLLVLIAAGIILYNVVLAPLVRVPDLVGKTSTEAIVALNNAGLSLGTLTEKPTSGIADGIVLNQSPRVDSQMRKGSKVDITVAKAGDTTIVPALTGRSESEAQSALTDKRLSMNVVATYNDSAPKGTIVGQLPVADTVVPATSQVTALVSQGPYRYTVSVPRVIGLNEEDAVKMLKAKGLIPHVSYASTSYGTLGEVVMQTPASKSTLSPKSVVQILVSKDMGGALAAVPDVVGMTAADAQKTLIEAGFSIDSQLTVDPGMPQGSVSAQTPAAKDTLLKPGETVSLLISAGKTSRVTVPSVLGSTVKQAKQELEALGFEVFIVGDTDEKHTNYAVTQQFPAGQTAYNLGLPVLLYAPASGQ